MLVTKLKSCWMPNHWRLIRIDKQKSVHIVQVTDVASFLFRCLYSCNLHILLLMYNLDLIPYTMSATIELFF